MKFTNETNPKKFLDTCSLLQNDIIKLVVYHKSNKLFVSLISEIPKRYKLNAINGDLYRTWRINLNFHCEKKEIRNNFSSAG